HLDPRRPGRLGPGQGVPRRPARILPRGAGAARSGSGRLVQFILLGTAVSLIVGLLLTTWVIDLFRARGIGALIREDGPATHFVKHGTPTMGGLVLLAAATLGYIGGHIHVGGGVRFSGFTPGGILVLA